MQIWDMRMSSSEGVFMVSFMGQGQLGKLGKSGKLATFAW